jgi:DNA repair protein RadC
MQSALHDPEPAGPRERLLMNGADALADAELLAVLLGTGTAGEPVSVLAARLLQKAGGLRNLDRLGVSALSEQSGIGTGKACRLRAALELGRRAAAVPLSRGRRITCSRDVDAAFRPRLGKAAQEHFLAVALDTKNRPIAEVEVAVGGLSACALRPADVFRVALRESAAALLLVHNHPSGDPSPSTEDVAFTRRLRRAGELVGVEVLDHIVIGEQGYFSFLDAGLLSAGETDTAP